MGCLVAILVVGIVCLEETLLNCVGWFNGFFVVFWELVELYGVGDLNEVDCGCFFVVVVFVFEKNVLFRCS